MEFDVRHLMFGQEGKWGCLESRNSFMTKSKALCRKGRSVKINKMERATDNMRSEGRCSSGEKDELVFPGNPKSRKDRMP